VDGGDSDADVYSMLVIGQDSHGIVGFGNTLPDDPDPGTGGELQNNTGKQIKPVEIIAHAPGESGAADPLNQRGSLAWKMSLDTVILNGAFIYDLEHITAQS
jgi:N4-gp56 family major capsid protein